MLHSLEFFTLFFVFWNCLLCVLLCVVCVVCVVCSVLCVHPTNNRTSQPRTTHNLTALNWTTQQFRSFFSTLPQHFCSFCLSLGVNSLNSGGFCEHGDPQINTFGLSGCRVKQQQQRGNRGNTTTRQQQTSTFQGNNASNNPTIQRTPPSGGRPPLSWWPQGLAT